jgi:lipopolysaccharide export system permease protein
MILARYFVRETLKLMLIILSGLFVIYLTTRFATQLGEAAEGKVAPQHINLIVMLKMLVSLKDLLPMSLLLGIFGAGVRLQQGSEWTAMRAAGLSHQALLRPTFMLTGVTAIAVALITLGVGPQAERTLKELREQTENEATIAGVKAGAFREFSDGDRVFYAEGLAADGTHLLNAFVTSRRAERTDVMRSERAFIETDTRSRDRFVVFEDGSSWAGEPGDLDFVITEFSRYALRIESREPTFFGAHVGFVATDELLRHRGPIYAAELQWRLALPLCTLLGPPLALLIAVGTRGGNWYLGLMTTVAAYFLYTNLLGVGRAMMRKGALPPVLGLWPIHLLFVAVFLALLAWQRGWLRRYPRRRPRQELLPG